MEIQETGLFLMVLYNNLNGNLLRTVKAENFRGQISMILQETQDVISLSFVLVGHCIRTVQSFDALQLQQCNRSTNNNIRTKSIISVFEGNMRGIQGRLSALLACSTFW